LTPGAGRTVLVVDDDAALRMLCRVNLELDGYDVVEAASVDEAADRVAENDVDVVLLDIRMGEGLGTGLTLLDRLPEGKRPAIALLTGSVDLSRFEQPLDVDAIISKPFSLDELATVVRDLAAR
jgi:two-component system, OmpR family, phosphate regulon response regulator PhoB